jgi:hypothetical protein
MTVELIGILTLALAFVGMFRDPPFLVYGFFCATLLGSAAAFILTSLGGTNISPGHLLLGFLTLKLLLDRNISRNALDGLAVGQPGFWLLLTVAYSAFSAYFMPIIFMGQTFVFPVRIVSSNIYTDPLAPSTANLTQSIYLIGDFVCFFVLSGYAKFPTGLRTLSNAALATIVLNLFFTVADLATYATGTTELLQIIRNANYSLLSDTEIVGFKRIVGSFIEASSFGAATLGYFAYTSKLWLLGVYPYRTAILSALSLLALVFSTSTTAYVGLAIFLTFCYFEACVQAVFRRMTKQMALLIIAAPIILLVIGLAIALNDAASTYVQNMADTMILKKMSTQSGDERSSWNRQALQTFFDTYGFGAGNGSLRASTFPLAVLANLGFVGAILFCLFFVGIFFGRSPAMSDRIDDANRRAARSACLAGLITATVSGALTDLGLSFFAFAAIACSRPTYSYAIGRYRGQLSAETHSSPKNSSPGTEVRFRPDLS